MTARTSHTAGPRRAQSVRVGLGAVALLAVSFAALVVVFAAQRFPLSDVLVYRAEGEAVWNGTDLYGFTVTAWELPATYPPFAALLFVPVALVPLSVAKAAFVAGNAALLALLVALSLRMLPHPSRRTPASAPTPPSAPTAPSPSAPTAPSPSAPAPTAPSARFAARSVRPTRTLPLVLAVTAGALWLEPVFQTLLFGQINLALACLVLWDLGRPDGARAKGFALGVAAGIKLTPAVFAVYLLLTGRVRAGMTAVAGFACTVGVGALVLPGASAEFWTRRVFETARVGKAWIVDNQSLQGLIARLVHHPDPGPLWLAPAAVLAAAGLWLARRLYVRGADLHGADPGGGRPGAVGDFWGVMVTTLLSLLVSPISWSHHWVWCVPLLVGLAVTAPRWVTVAVAAVFTARTMWLVPKAGDLDLHLAWWHQPLASPYPLLTLALLGAAFVLVHAPRTRPGPGPTVPAARRPPDDEHGSGPWPWPGPAG